MPGHGPRLGALSREVDQEGERRRLLPEVMLATDSGAFPECGRGS
jgi:hypothetical protein